MDATAGLQYRAYTVWDDDGRLIYVGMAGRSLKEGSADTPEAAGFKRKGLLDRLRPRHARLAGHLLVEADEQLARPLVVLFEPRAELGRRGKEEGLHADDRRVGGVDETPFELREAASR